MQTLMKIRYNSFSYEQENLKLQDFFGIRVCCVFARMTENLTENAVSVKTPFDFYGFILGIDRKTFVIEDKIEILKRHFCRNYEHQNSYRKG